MCGFPPVERSVRYNCVRSARPSVVIPRTRPKPIGSRRLWRRGPVERRADNLRPAYDEHLTSCSGMCTRGGLTGRAASCHRPRSQRATEVAARAPGQVMATQVVQKHHLWLDLGGGMLSGPVCSVLPPPGSASWRCGRGLRPAVFDRLGADGGDFAPTASCCLHPAVGSVASACSPPMTPPCGSLPSHAAPAAAFTRVASRRRPQWSVTAPSGRVPR